MKKILIVDDREERQYDDLSKVENFDINAYADIIDNWVGLEHKKLFEHLTIEDFSELPYTVIIVHQSVFENDFRKEMKLEKLCKKNNKDLVLFSGQISTISYKSDPKILKLNSSVLYSKNLELFLKKSRSGEPKIEILGYGENWELSLLINIKKAINRFMSNRNEPEIMFEDFRAQVKLDSIKFLISFEEPNTTNINREYVESLLEKISTEINSRMEY
ncbi:hypothetical protein ACFLR3_00935 [Campylobacterota bacterium]